MLPFGHQDQPTHGSLIPQDLDKRLRQSDLGMRPASVIPMASTASTSTSAGQVHVSTCHFIPFQSMSPYTVLRKLGITVFDSLFS